ncbi:hypothetical protein BT96DRAFT_1003898 [Gymnopus androsaceus JB14]|uniref:Uncharacterized protein n=1 Tax=Gymnopus androsaceus JB14 TaxID=1447944 RepID=A0A6A4GTN1_9AGAR|nr:hypothetical protein BT96DRAFT_1003898 [Gymnopus androsaceus JB14]
MVLDTNANDPATVQVNTAANAADPPSIDSQRNWEDRAAKQRLRNNDLQNSGASNILSTKPTLPVRCGIGGKRCFFLQSRRMSQLLLQLNSNGVGKTELLTSNSETMTSENPECLIFPTRELASIEADTRIPLWERREDMYPPQYTGRGGYSPTNQRNPQYNCGFQAGWVNRTRNYPHVSEDRKLQGGHSPPGGNGPPGDNGDVDGDGRDDKSRIGKKPARCHRTPWDDSSKGESPPPPPLSSPPSSSEDSSPSDDN